MPEVDLAFESPISTSHFDALKVLYFFHFLAKGEY